MQLTDIRLQQFRSYTDAHFTFDPAITLITGKNGTGKTNLLEAIYVLLQGSSFRVSDSELIERTKEWWRIDGNFLDSDRQLRYQTTHKPAKQLIINDTVKRFTYKNKLPLVLFEPTDLQLIHGSPTRRRDSLDMMLTALSQPYKLTRGRYERALQQRNSALKKQPSNLEDVLFAWDILLSEYGVTITEARRDIVTKLNTVLPYYYSEIAGVTHELSIEYQSELPTAISISQYVAHLHHKLDLDRLRGTTSIGPHRDDITFYLNGSQAKLSASRGEVRSILLALKLAYAHLLEETYRIKPLILLDDVFSELDIERQENLLNKLTENQTIITDTKDMAVKYGKCIQL